MIATISTPNSQLADALEQIAVMLEVRQSSPFRINAYKRAVQSIREQRRSLAEIFEQEGTAGLVRLEGIGKSIGSAVEEYLKTGKIDTAERMEQDMTPKQQLMMVPGIGETLAEKLAGKFGIKSLEQLEVAAHDGRLGKMEGFGSRRVRSIQQHLDVMLGRSARLRAERSRKQGALGVPPEFEDPDVQTLLAIDAKYRKKAASGALRTIAPRRFNPNRKSWLPIMNGEHNGWLYTAMFSNTARAHELGKINDWVVIFFEKQGKQHQCTVVTEWRGVLAGKRVVRGREQECFQLVMSDEIVNCSS